MKSTEFGGRLSKREDLEACIFSKESCFLNEESRFEGESMGSFSFSSSKVKRFGFLLLLLF